MIAFECFLLGLLLLFPFEYYLRLIWQYFIFRFWFVVIGHVVVFWTIFAQSFSTHFAIYVRRLCVFRAIPVECDADSKVIIWKFDWYMQQRQTATTKKKNQIRSMFNGFDLDYIIQFTFTYFAVMSQAFISQTHVIPKQPERQVKQNERTAVR